MTPAIMAQMARERALQMARSDCQSGIISKDEIITQARIYESYISGKPVIVTALSCDLSGSSPSEP
jgi:hypothetical protein